MVKSTDPGMDTHLAEETTTLASAWLITRLDGDQFRFTTASESIDIDIGDGNGVQTYRPNEGYNRTNFANNADLDVGNLNLVGVFDDDQIDETELRRGLFDFAEVRIFYFNWDDTSDGIIRIMRGYFGEVIVTDKGIFQVELRDLTTVFSRILGEKVSKDCRDDLGGPFCLVPIYPDAIQTLTSYSVGDFVRIPTDTDSDQCSQIIMNFEDTDGSTGLPGFDNESLTFTTNPTLVGTAQIDTAQMPAGGSSTSSLLLDGNSDYIFWADDPCLEMGGNDVTIQCHFRLNATGVFQCIASKYQATTGNRSWFIRVTSADVIEFQVYSGGATLDITLTGTTTLSSATDYHLAVIRKPDGDWEMFLDGVSEAGPTTPSANPFDGNADFRIGALESGGVGNFFDGWIDSFEFLVGFARWTSGFTPPTGNIAAPTAIPDFSTLNWEDFGDRIYECTVAGTTGCCIQQPDTTVGNSHDQSTAEFTANNSWMRAVEVTAVGVNPRRDFTVTELTPNSGQTVGSNQTPSAVGFPDDWFNGGVVFWETGDNAGQGNKTQMEVRDFIADDGITIEQIIELFLDLPFDIQVGDKARIMPGCDKTFATCKSKFNNPRRFKGEPFVPGADTLGQYPDAR